MSTWYRKDIDKLKQVQQRATRTSRGLKERQLILGLFSLEKASGQEGPTWLPASASVEVIKKYPGPSEW